MDSPTSGTTNPPPLPGQSNTPPSTPPTPPTPSVTPPITPPVPAPIVPPPIPPTAPVAPPPPPVPSTPVHTPPTPPASPVPIHTSSVPLSPPTTPPHPTPPLSSPPSPTPSTGSLVVPPQLSGQDKDKDDEKPVVPPLSPPPTSNSPDSLSKLPSDHAESPSTLSSPSGAVSTTSPDPLSHDKSTNDMPQLGGAPTESRMTHEVTPDDTTKKGHKSLGIIIIVGIILLALGGLAYAASSCSVSIPGLSSLFGCETDTTLSTDQGFTESTTTTP